MNAKIFFTWRHAIGIALSCFIFSSSASAQSNLALNKIATASSAISPAGNAVDGNANSRWESAHGINNATLQVDLGATFNISHTSIDWEAANAATYEVLGSNDNTNWTLITFFSGGSFGNRTDNFSLSGSFRFLRINATSRSTGNNWGYSIWEWRIFGSALASSSSSRTISSSIASSSSPRAISSSIASSSSSRAISSSVSSISNTTNLAIGGITSASTELNPSANAIDGNVNTRWESAHGADPSWISVDLKAEKVLSSVVIRWEAANAANYEVQGSNNNLNWVTLATRTGGAFGNRTDTIAVSGNFRFVRIFGTARSAGNNWGYSIFELQVFGVNTAASSIRSSSSSSSSITIDINRSLFVHDSDTLQAADFSFRSTLQQLVNQLNALNPSNPTTVEQLFARMWDTQNPTPGKIIGGEKCNGVLNGFSIECRPIEGSQAEDPSIFVSNYLPIGLVNRLDLRDDITFNDCGEYRVIYGNQGGRRNLIIFEAQVPNPTPGVAAGCKPIAQFWQNLSAENNINARAAALQNFYFVGIPSANVRPVIDIRNYTNGSGQIRTNMFMGSDSWNLKEFKVGIDNQGLSMIQPVSVKSNPVDFLFNGNSGDTRASEFQSDFITNMDSLLGNFTTFSLTVERDAHNNGQSHASGPINENLYSSAFFETSTNAFQQAVNNKLISAGSNLTPSQVINRATAMTCGGCHQPSNFGLHFVNAIGPNQSWPETNGFTHINEFASAGIFQLSPALINVFLPARLTSFNNYLSSVNSPSIQAAALPRSNTPSVNSNSSAASSQAPRKFNKRAG